MRTAIAILLLMLLMPTARGQTQSTYLAWSPSSDAATNPSLTYNVYRASSCTGTFAKINAAPVTTTNYLDNQPPAGSYCYCVTAVLNGLESNPSNTAIATILPVQPRTNQTAAPPPTSAQEGCSHAGSLINWIRCVVSRPHPKPTRPPPVP
jgi:hypothetical protein